MSSKNIEKALGSIAALLGESAEASAAVEALRDMASDCMSQGKTMGSLLGEAPVLYCLDRIALAVEKAISAQRLASYDCGVEDGRRHVAMGGEQYDMGYHDGRRSKAEG